MAFIYDVGTGIAGAVTGAFARQIIFDRFTGKPFVVGTFSSYNGGQAIAMFRTNLDGSRDTSFNVNSGVLYAGGNFAGSDANTVVQDSVGNYYIGGTFNMYTDGGSYQNIACNKLTSFTSGGTHNTLFNAGVRSYYDGSGHVYAMTIDSNDKIYVAGSFAQFNGSPQFRLVRMTTTGAKDTGFNIGTGFNNENNEDLYAVEGIKIQPTDGKILVWGTFTKFTGTTVTNLIRLNTDGSRDTSFSWTGGTCEAVGFDNNGRIIVGYFSGGIRGTMWLNNNGTRNTSFSINTLKDTIGNHIDGRLRSILVDTLDRVYVGGGFSGSGLIRLNPNGTIETGFPWDTFYTGGGSTGDWSGNGVNSIMATDSNGVYVGGQFSTYNTPITAYSYVYMYENGAINPLPTVTTTAVTDVLHMTGNTGGNVTSQGAGTVTNRGVCWNTSGSPTTGNTHTHNGTGGGAFTSIITGLTSPETTYYVRAYAVNAWGIVYGNQVTYTTRKFPTLTTKAATAITGIGANLGGNVSNYGDWEGTPLQNGVCWNTTGNPTKADSVLADGSSTNFTVTTTTMSQNTLYYVKAYSDNKYGTGYGNQITFTTATLPTLTTNSISAISYSGATSGGIISGDGGNAITSKGVCWNTIGTPTIADSKTNNGSGSANFSSLLTGLSKGTTYYVRAYATNIVGTSYGNERIFTTYGVPIVDTSIPYGIDIFTAILGGNVISGNGYTVTERGIYYGLTPTPTTKLQIGSGLGLYSASPALLDNSIYYVMAYAINAAGIGYGEILTFKTLLNIFPPPFCDGTNYELIQPSTCGNSDGIMWIESLSYFEYYDFTLTDAFGNTYAPNLITGEFTGLAAGWYFLSVTPFPQYQYIYGTDTCFISWLPIIDIDTDLSLNSVSIRNAQCQPFDRVFGRIYYKIDGFDTGHTYSFYSWKTDAQPYITPPTYYQKLNITSNNDVQIPKAAADCYYALLVDETTGCHLLLDVHCVGEETPFSLGGLKKIWIAPWSDDIEYNYWDSKDEDYFLEFEDTSFFTSTKITEFYSHSGGTIQWYSLPVAPQVVKLSQKLNKVRQGFIFEDALDIAISAADALKWQEIQPIVNIDNKWIIVCIDDNDFAWTSGYRHGARVIAFKNQSGARGEDNGYTLSFSSQSENKILTAIDKAYITNHII